MIKLLHIDKGIPQGIVDMVVAIEKNLKDENLELSYHIISRLGECDRKHSYTASDLLRCVKGLKNSPSAPFEVEIECLPNAVIVITKYVVRITFNRFQDLCVAIRGNKIITAWLNSKNDNHKTVDLSKYDTL